MENETSNADYWLAVDGDRAASERIVREHSQGMVKLAMAMGLPHSTAEDAAHAAWMKFFRHVGAVREDRSEALNHPERLSFWLNQVTRNVVRDIYRTTRRQKELTERVEREAEALGHVVYQPDEEHRLVREQQRRSMWRAIETLEEQCRVLLGLRLQDPPVSYREIAQLLGRPEGAIGPTYLRCIEKLRSAMGVSAHE